MVSAAIELADRDGIESISMRKLAQELGVEAMSLYTYVRSKDDLLDGMVDTVIAMIPTDADADAADHWADPDGSLSCDDAVHAFEEAG